MDAEGISKTFYLFTILFSLRLFYLAWVARQTNQFIRTIFVVYVALVPTYAVFAAMYVFDVAYHSWVGYLGWTAINVMFLATDGMLLEYIVRHHDRAGLSR